MAITRFFDKTIIVLRLKALSGNKRSFNTTATVNGAFQEASSQSRVALGMTQDRLWVAYVGIDQDINEGDLCRINGASYKVIEKTPKNYGINQHLELLLVEYDS